MASLAEHDEVAQLWAAKERRLQEHLLGYTWPPAYDSWWPLIRVCTAFFLLGVLFASAVIFEVLAW